MKNRNQNLRQILLFVGTLLLTWSPSTAAPEAKYVEPTLTESDEILMHFPRSIVRNVVMKQTPVREVINELCKRAGKKAIMDKSVDGKFVTAEFTDSTLAEVLSEVFDTSGLQAKFLTDELILVEAKNAPQLQYTPPNTGDSDRSAPLSIEADRLAREREANRKIQQAREVKEALRKQQEFYGTYYGKRYQLIPPPPPTVPMMDYREMPSNQPMLPLPPPPLPLSQEQN